MFEEVILAVLITAGVLLIFGGIGLWVFADWMENNEE
jgi:hypothetical protein|tara:strand:- start:404 stop:514 length:111 start_codon:yes stop_codon:yes gene_type:complete